VHASDPHLLLPGAVVDRYRVDAAIGTGGMAEVYRVTHERLGTTHALKVLHVHLPSQADRLLAEGRLQGALRHPNVLAVTDAFSVDGAPALVLELVEGGSLYDRLDGAGRLGAEQGEQLFRSIVAGVAHAHDHGVIHRDLKPANVLLARIDGVVVPKVADFGLAKHLVRTDGGQTQHGRAMGTPAYMPPEQFRNARDVDERADVYALGCILYEILSGQRAFDGPDTLAIMRAVLDNRYAPLSSRVPGMPARLCSIVERCLHKDPFQRPASAGVLLELLEGGFGRSRPADTFLPEHDLQTVDVPTPQTTRLSNLVPAGDLFLGRDREMAELEALFQAGERQVTLLGPPGVGRSRLARELALRLAREFSGGAWTVKLDGLDKRADVLQAIGAAVGISLDRNRSWDGVAEQIGYALGSRGRTLLVLDHVSLVAWEVGAILEGWQGEHDGLVVLSTSQQPLQTPHEARYRVDGLEVADGVALFETRATTHRRGFTMGDDTASVVAELVERLDGLPLAIELAAARATLMSPAQMLQRLDQRFRLLSRARGSSGVTLRTALDEAWALLDGWEQRALAGCSIFRGGFTVEAAERVLDLPPEAPWAVDLLDAVHDKSLLRSTETAGEVRLTMLESVRVYAAEKLGEEGPALRAHHANYFLEVGARLAEKARGHDARRGLDALESERPNLVAAATDTSLDAGLRAEVTLALEHLLRLRGPLLQRLEILGAIVDHPEPGIRCRALAARADARWVAGEYAGAEADASAAYEAALAADDDASAVMALTALVRVLRIQARYEEAEPWVATALELAKGRLDARLMSRCYQQVGNLRYAQSRSHDALVAHTRALDLARQAGDLSLEVSARSNRAQALRLLDEEDEARFELDHALRLAYHVGQRQVVQVLLQRGNAEMTRSDVEAAKQTYELALDIARRYGLRRHVATLSMNCGVVSQSEGDIPAAMVAFREARDAHLRAGNARQVAIALANLAVARFERGDNDREAFHEALESARAVRFGRLQVWLLAHQACLEARTGAIDEAREAQAQAQVLAEGIDAATMTGLLELTDAWIRRHAGEAPHAADAGGPAQAEPAAVLGRMWRALPAQNT